MGKAILITGGARSGKSRYAEKLARDLGGDILYIATAVAFDDEMKNRIKKHKEARPDEWDTYEGYKGLGQVIMEQGGKYKGILLDCITVMITNIILEQVDFGDEIPSQSDFERAEELINDEIDQLMQSIRQSDATVIMVTNELGSGIVPENLFARIFRDIAGRSNQQIAEAADEVYMAVCGIPVKIK